MFIKSKRIHTASLVVVLALVGFSSLPASAHAETGSSTETTNTEVKKQETTSTTDKEALRQKMEAAKKSKEQQLQAQKAELAKKAEQKLEQRKKTCEEKQKGITNRTSALVKTATKHKSNFDRFFEKAKAFHDSKNLDTPNYDTLVAEATAAQSAAASSLTALTELAPTIKCDSPDSTVQNISAFKTALSDTRSKLKAYRGALSALLSALQSSNSNDNSQQGDN